MMRMVWYALVTASNWWWIYSRVELRLPNSKPLTAMLSLVPFREGVSSLRNCSRGM